MKIGDTTAGYFIHLLDSAEALGLSRARLLQDIGLPERDLLDGEARIDLIYLMRLGHTIIQRTGARNIGLTAGSRASITRFGLAGLAAMTAGTLGEALRSLVAFEPLYARCYRGSSQLRRHEGCWRLSFYSIAPYNDYTFFVVDAVLANWAAIIRFLTGRDDLVSATHIEFPTPPYHEAYTRELGPSVHFHQECNELLLAPDALDAIVIHRNGTLHHLLLKQCEEQLSRVSLANTWRNRVQRILGTMLHGRTPAIDEVAAALGIPSWTLRRKLRDETASFQDIVDDMRRDVALSYMRNTELSFGEIAYLLGFSTPGAFQRAFKRWTDTTPGEFRRQRQLDRLQR
jgi:AraC-like DNA-binding protein